MQISQIKNTNQSDWNDFVKKHSLDFGLLQAWEWGEFQQALGRQVVRVVAEEDRILGVAQIIQMEIKGFFRYWYCPRGPMAESDLVFEAMLVKIAELAKAAGIVFLRFDPALTQLPGVSNKLINVGQVQPKQTLILDLCQEQNQLLSAMKSKTRYNIKVAGKHGVRIDQGSQYLEDFWRLTQLTSDRQEITPHPKHYYQTLVEILAQAGILEIWVAKLDNRVIAANLMIFFGDWAVYLHGASDYSYRRIMAPYLLQWQAILEAQSRHKKYYDFWGVDRLKWPGVTRFKTGFCPDNEFTHYIGAYDEVYRDFWYNTYKLFRKF